MRHLLASVSLAVLTFAFTAAPGGSQVLLHPTRVRQAQPAGVLLAPAVTPQCSGGIAYDDGTVENGLFFDNDPLDVVMRFDVGQPGALVDQVCLCWTRDDVATDLDFDLVFYAADGPGGQPGTLIDTVPASVKDVPQFPNVGLYSFDLTGSGIATTGDDVYIGASWNAATASSFFLCTDENGPGGQPMYASPDLGMSWQDLATLDPQTRALVVRADFDTGTSGPSVCTPDATTLCLSDGRFQVTIDWQTNQGTSGQGMAQPLTSDTGYFWFFNQDNVEVVVKVLRACPVNDRFWVFAGGLTNVQTRMVVTDTANGQRKIYSNPQVTPFQPIQDTNAFATCP